MYEFQAKDSCSHENCMFSHRFPRELTSNETLAKQIKEKEEELLKRKKEKWTTYNQAGSPNHDSNPDSNAASRISRICVNEFTEAGSCRYKDMCYFDHNFPEELRENSEIWKEIETKKQGIEAKRKDRWGKEDQEGPRDKMGNEGGRYGPKIKQPSRNIREKPAENGKNLDANIEEVVNNFLYTLQSLIQKQKHQ